MIEVEIYHNRVFITQASPDELTALKKALVVFSPIFNPGPGQPRFSITNLYDWKTKSFPTGFLDEAAKKLDKKDIDISFKDHRTYPKPYLHLQTKNELEPLWPTQLTAWEGLKVNNIGIVEQPPGTGKTRLIEEVIFYRQVRTLVIVPSVSIQMQMYNRWSKILGKNKVSFKAPSREQEESQSSAGEDPDNPNVTKLFKGYNEIYDQTSESPTYKKMFGRVPQDEEEIAPPKRLGSNRELYPDNSSEEEKFLKKKNQWPQNKKWPIKKIPYLKKAPKPLRHPKGAEITILCYQSLELTSIHFLENIECVIVDEAHHASAPSISSALLLMKMAAYRYAFSATPWRDRSDEMKLLTAAIGQNYIYRLSGGEAVAQKVIAKPTLQIIISPTPKVFLRNARNWRSIVELGIVGNESRNNVIIKKAIECAHEDKNVFICVDEIAHLEILSEKLKKKLKEEKSDIEVLTVHGQQNKDLNSVNIKKIGTSQKGLISIGTMAVGEGTDMPWISVVILASGGKGSVRFLQRVGRGTRKVTEEVLIIDFEDWFNPTLMRHSRKRQEIFKKYYKEE